MRQALSVFIFVGVLVAFDMPDTLPTSENQQTVHSNPLNMRKKEKALAFVQAALSQDEAKVRELAALNYIQHNPFIPTGLEAFIGLFPVLKENGTSAEAFRVLEDDNFVVLHHLWKGAKPFGAEEMVSFDILRFDEQGKIVEHWDAMMPNTPPNPSGRTLLDGPSEVVDLDATEANKELVLKLVDDVLFGKNPNNVTKYISTETYHQHNPSIKDGLDGLQEAFHYLIANNDMFQYKKLHKAIAEGNFVLTVNEGEWHGNPHIFYDLFRIENGKVVEHWDVIQQIPTENLANKNTMFNF